MISKSVGVCNSPSTEILRQRITHTPPLCAMLTSVGDGWKKLTLEEEAEKGSPGVGLLDKPGTKSIRSACSCRSPMFKANYTLLCLVAESNHCYYVARLPVLYPSNDNRAYSLIDFPFYDYQHVSCFIPFEENFLMYGFCETLHISLLQDVQRGMGYNDLSAPVNHDIREKVITACLKFFNVCDWKSLNFSNKQHILSLLDSIIHEYKLRSKSETDDIDSYFTDMLLKAQKFRNMLEPYESPKTDL
ncbi:unnamed protein product [Schistosoma mattheei]|uniref:Uncharacterized protein n=1 Tax=Schistosoma mattheei TaxID=31246 RepID=A0A183PPG4_9TREM|nr:unnamed protein product [Schistosoma mattheei]